MINPKDYEPVPLMFFQSEWERFMYYIDHYIKLTKDKQAIADKYNIQCQIEVAKLNDKWR